ncbi:DUF4870 domain-containing protein [uncultured Microbacterium sp.]|uniref:DUF4870 domain-containing protein n=1 Tax=uncultured Microbacterium sp. TaxID=191216 RepID=A0A1Y5P8R8_9MICO|nr:DUF4870 domain-containing protein [uncultured Microbacterium sp.]SBS72501.1 conserved membrane hypothetical protein [uncultured Microbacterium sp.]
MTMPPQPPYGGTPPVQPMSPADEKMWATLTHLSGIFFSFLGPLVGYLVLRDRGPFVRAHTATALNFQLTLLIAYVVSGILVIVVIGAFLYPLVAVAGLVLAIIAAVKANQGEWYTYPLTITFVR